MDAAGWLALVGGVGVLGTFAGLFLYGVSLVGSVKGSLLGVAEPAGAMIIAAMWLHTPFFRRRLDRPCPHGCHDRPRVSLGPIRRPPHRHPLARRTDTPLACCADTP